MALVLLEHLKTVVTEVARSQKQDAVGPSRTALVTQEDSQERNIGALMVKAGGKRGRDVAGAGTGVLNNENNRRIRWKVNPKC